jgi:EAL domain-containing protein (putative c-di-GMP-specific phosphodiesterase class I)
VRASAGVAVSPDHGVDPTLLLQRADVAMYAAKSGDRSVALYRQEDDQHTPRRLALAADLRRALVSDELVVHWMPKADLRNGAVVGAEALVRWRHPEHGWVAPDEFVPVAEQTGLIGALTRLVLREAVWQCARWRQEGTPLTIAVNISTRDLLDPGLVDDVAGLLERADVPPSSLTLEITESSIMGDTTRSSQVLDELSALGVRLSVDDFGTGYSSLSYLQRLPVQELKVDKSFVFRVGLDAGDRSIVRSIVELGHSLGLTVVAEGVEDRLSWDRLMALGCDVAQGYYLSRPLPADQLSEWLLVDRQPAPA